VIWGGLYRRSAWSADHHVRHYYVVVCGTALANLASCGGSVDKSETSPEASAFDSGRLLDASDNNNATDHAESCVVASDCIMTLTAPIVMLSRLVLNRHKSLRTEVFYAGTTQDLSSPEQTLLGPLFSAARAGFVSPSTGAGRAAPSKAPEVRPSATSPF
jgi:hypothetical protein